MAQHPVLWLATAFLFGAIAGAILWPRVTSWFFGSDGGP